VRCVLDLQWVLAALGADGARAAQVFGDGSGVERGRHHDQAKIGPARLLQAAQQRQRQVAFEMPLVKFIEHHAAHPLEIRVGKQAAREHPFREESQARGGAGDFLEAHLISHRPADLLAALRRDVARRQPSRETARFEHQHFAIVK